MDHCTATVSDDPKEAARAAHQLWNGNEPQVVYNFTQKPRLYRPHPKLAEQNVWTFRDFNKDTESPLTMIHARYGEPSMVYSYNELPANHKGFGNPSHDASPQRP